MKPTTAPPACAGSPFSLISNVPSRPSRDLGVEHRLDHALARAVGGPDRVDHDLCGLCAVDRVRVDRLAAEPRQEVLGEGRSLALELVDRHAGDAEEHPGRRLAGLVDRLLGREPVRCEQLDGAVVRAEHGHLVLDHLGAVLVDQATEEDGVCAGCLDRVEERLVAGGLRIPGGEPGDLDAEVLRRVAGVRRDAEAVRLLVVQDVEALDALRLHELGHGRALVGVVRDDAGVVARARRVVLVGLGGVAARPALGQADVRVRRRHHRDAAARSVVQDRDDDGGAAGVEGADDTDDLLVPGIGLPVRRALARVPLAGLRRRVVARLVRDVVIAGLPVLLLEEEADRLDDLRRLRPRRALEREVRRQQHVRIALALVLDRGARRRGQRLDIARRAARLLCRVA